jgi:hypothetical protein
LASTDENALKTAFFSGLKVDIKGKGEVSYLSGVMEHPGQKKLHFDSWRYITLMWGRRTGKTIAAAAEIVWTMSKRNQKIWIVAPNYELTDRVFEYVWKWIVVDECFGPGSIVRSAKTKDNRYIELKWNAVVRGKSAEAPSSLIGEQLDLIVCDESARFPEQIWVEALEPCTIDRQGRVVFISTPRGRNWFYQYYLRGFAPETVEKGWASLKLATRDNPFVDQEWLRSKQDETPAHIWRREYEASPEEYSGLCYPEFKAFDYKDGGHLFDPREIEIPGDWTAYGGIDIGWRHPTGAVICRVDPENNLWFTVEYKDQSLAHEDHAKGIKARYPKPVYMWLGSPDATREQGLRKNEKGETPQDIYRQNGIYFYPAFDRVQMGIGIVNNYFRATLQGAQSRHPHIYISNDLYQLIEDLQQYVFEDPPARKDQDAPEKPRKKNDDLVDAFRYVVAQQPRYVREWYDRQGTPAGDKRYGHVNSKMARARKTAKPVTPNKPGRGRPRLIGAR